MIRKSRVFWKHLQTFAEKKYATKKALSAAAALLHVSANQDRGHRSRRGSQGCMARLDHVMTEMDFDAEVRFVFYFLDIHIVPFALIRHI